ncbi:MAG: class I SAM-dependent methyltransferase [Planctomycetaceae bacterium]|nr:class I SAM-dependent methyltransferase [Planctomycetaceae bacterium]
MSRMTERTPTAERSIDTRDATVTCPCGSTQVLDLGRCRELSRTPDTQSAPDPGRLYRCRKCRLLFRAPALSTFDAEALYESISGDEWQYDAWDSSAWILAHRRLQLRTPGDLLDIGSFDGQFLAQAPPGWRRAAIEPNPGAVAHLQQQGIDAIQGVLNDDVCSRLQGKFDVVAMFDVFEHLHDPLHGLRLAAACLRPGGALYLSTGNADHWTWRLLGSEHPYLATEQHLVVGGETWFRDTCRSQQWQPPRMTRISHKTARGLSRVRAAELAVYFGARRRPWPYRGLASVLHKLPGCHHRLHRRYMPHIDQLQDHLFVEITP